MPWRETSPMEQRLQFVREYESDLLTMTELAAQYGISRKTGYKWLAQYDAAGVRGLFDRSRRPHYSPQATDPELIDAMLTLRRRHPRHEAAGSCRAARSAGGVAESIDRVYVAQTARPGAAPPSTQSVATRAAVAAAADHRRQRGLDDRFQRRISDR